MVVVSLTGFLISQEEYHIFVGQMRNLAFYVHRSYLLLIQCVMERFPQDPEQLQKNVWAHSLSKLIATKCGKKRSPRSEKVQMLKQNNDMLCNLLKAILTRIGVERGKKDNTATRLNILSHRIFTAIGDIVRALDKLAFQQAKELIGKSLREDYSLIE